MADHVERAIDTAAFLRRAMTSHGWQVVNDSAMAVLCLEPPSGFPPVRTIARAVLDSGVAWISVTTFEGRDVIRVCLTHGGTTLHDVRELINALQNCGDAARSNVA